MGAGSGDAAVSVVLAHDYLTEAGGAERVVSALAEHHAHAPILTSAVRPETLDPVLAAAYRSGRIRVSRLAPLLADKRRAKAAFPLLPAAFRAMAVPRADVLLASSSGFAHHLRPQAGTLHAWYCHTPPRFLWDGEAYFAGQPRLARSLRPVLAALRRLDRRAAARVDLVIANSRHIAERIRAVYGRDAAVLLPPVPCDRFRPTDERSGRLLVLSRLLPYKRIDVALAAAASAGLPLDICGEGPDRPRLERLAGPGVRFLGRVSDAEARALLARCSALLVPGREDLGLTVVEAQASGRPPIVLAEGGARETVQDGVSGFWAAGPDPAAFAAAIRRSIETPLPVDGLLAAARRLDTPIFLSRLDALLAEAVERRGVRTGVSRPGGDAVASGREATP
jgi:glycosyltransferase involved in cell wall biosynthesis